ncbi:hypothetical protein C8J57DRAFT_484985 [Mycena rebaudengoi]|nr:hypothetical protein C8J57DRAFT_484985 [Mycena rebaudengoi]
MSTISTSGLLPICSSSRTEIRGRAVCSRQCASAWVGRRCSDVVGRNRDQHALDAMGLQRRIARTERDESRQRAGRMNAVLATQWRCGGASREWRGRVATAVEVDEGRARGRDAADNGAVPCRLDCAGGGQTWCPRRVKVVADEMREGVDSAALPLAIPRCPASILSARRSRPHNCEGVRESTQSILLTTPHHDPAALPADIRTGICAMWVGNVCSSPYHLGAQSAAAAVLPVLPLHIPSHHTRASSALRSSSCSHLLDP